MYCHYFTVLQNTRFGGVNRWASFIFYLEEPKRGGATVFHYAKRRNHTSSLEEQEMKISDCGLARMQRVHGRERFFFFFLLCFSHLQFFHGTSITHCFLNHNFSSQAHTAEMCTTHLAFKPTQNTALLFYSQMPDGTLDPTTEHSGSPVVEGEKHGANLFFWNGKRFQKRFDSSTIEKEEL